jgi:hypothetical protein
VKGIAVVGSSENLLTFFITLLPVRVSGERKTNKEWRRNKIGFGYKELHSIDP